MPLEIRFLGICCLFLAVGCGGELDGDTGDEIDAAVTAPLNVAAQAVSATEVVVSWSAGAGNTRQFVVERTPTVAPFPVALSAAVTRYPDKNVSAGSTYSYRVTAIDNKNRRASSQQVSVTVPPSNVQCAAGTTWNGASCVDVNECLANNGGCSTNAACTNTTGSRTCACNAGYSGDGITCTSTMCASGYQWNGASCVDVNECLANNGGCSTNAACTNTTGSRTCACNAGYSGDGITCTSTMCASGYQWNGASCVDVNECLANNGGCSTNAACTNTTGSRTCACNAGYSGDGITCTSTMCASGYQWNGASCVDVNECLANNGGCSTNAACTNTTGSRTCACNAGYSGDGITCTPTASGGGAQLWTRILASGSVLPQTVVSDSARSAIVAGVFSGCSTCTTDFGGGSTTSYQGGPYGFVAKYTAQNQFLWSKVLGPISGAAVDGQDNVIVAGTFSGTVDFGGVVKTCTPDPIFGQTYQADIFVAKYDSAGLLVWVKQFMRAGSEGANGVGVDADGNVIVAAQFSGTMTVDGSTLVSAGDLDLALIKLSGPSGATVWAQRWGGTEADVATRVAIDGAGDALVRGYHFGVGGTGANFVTKFSGATGAFTWTRGLPAGSVGGLTVDPSNNQVFVVGPLPSAFDFGGGVIAGPQSQFSALMYVATYDAQGAHIWSGSYAGVGQAAHADGHGHLTLSGMGGGSFGDVFIGAGAMVASLDLHGTSAPSVRWAKSLYSASTPVVGADAVAFDDSGRILVAAKKQTGGAILSQFTN